MIIIIFRICLLRVSGCGLILRLYLGDRFGAAIFIIYVNLLTILSESKYLGISLLNSVSNISKVLNPLAS